MEKIDEDASLEFKWLKKRGSGGKKKIQFYESFIYDGVEYKLYDCVYMYKEGLREPYIGKLTKIWDPLGLTKKVKVQWFFRPSEISKWLGDTKTLENEILLASGEGFGLANVNPLEAIAGPCNVVCVSKDCRNPQPSDEELKAADYIFYRTFDVQSCTILDKMDEKVGGLEIKYVFNRKEGENFSILPESTSDRKEENKSTTTCSEAQQLVTKSLPKKLRDDREDVKLSVKVDSKGESQDTDLPNLLAERTSLVVVEPSFGSGVDSKKLDESNSEMGKTDGSILKADKDNSKLKDTPFSKDKAEKDEVKLSIVSVHKVEAKERNKTRTGFDKLHDRPLKKIKSDDNTPSKDKQAELEVAHDSERLKDMPSKKSKVDNSISLPVDSKSKHEDKSPLHVNNLKDSGTSITNSEMGKTDSRVVKADKNNLKLKDMTCRKDKADMDEMKVSIATDHKVEAKERKKTHTGSDKLHDRSLKKIKSDDSTSSKEKQVELGGLKNMPSKKSKADNSIKLPVDSKSKHEDKLPLQVNNLKALGTSVTNSEMGKTDSCIVKADKNNSKLKDMSFSKDKVDMDEMKVSVVPIHKEEAKERNKTPTGSDKLHDRSLKKIKSDDNTPSKEKQVDLEVARDSDRLKDMPSKKSKVDNSIKLHVDSKSKDEDKLPLHVNNLKASGTSSTTGEKPNQKNGKVFPGSDKGTISAKVTDDLEGRIVKKTRADGSLKMPDNKKNDSVQKLSSNTNGSNGKYLLATSASSERKPKSGLALDSLGTNKEPKGEQSGESKRKLSMSKSPKVSALSTDRDKKATYQEFVVGPKPNADKSGWFRQLPWEQRLKNAYDQGTAILLHNVDPDYTSGEVEDIIWHAFTENCEAKILQRTAVSSPHYGQALILFKTKEAAQRVLTKLDEECLMLSNKRPLVGTTCPPISPRKNSKFFGHLAIDKIRLQNQREMDEAVSTSHFSQPNTIEYDMAMEWFLLQSRSKKWWNMMHKQQRDELKKLETNLIQK